MTHSSAAESAADLATALFRETFAANPAVGASAPGRVNLIGEHLDYNGGPVLPVAVDRRTAVVATAGDGWTMVSSIDDLPVAREPEAPVGAGWTDYVAGVIRELRALGAAPAGARIAVSSTLPIGAGLSSSAALTVGAAAALSRLSGNRLSAAELAGVAYRAEHDQVGVRCGRMDQTIIAHAQEGMALLFETGTDEVRHVPFGTEFWIVETGVSHRLTGGELNARRSECESILARLRVRWPALRQLADLPEADLGPAHGILDDPVLSRRLTHVVTETARTRAAATALAGNDLAEVGRLLYAGHESLRRDFESTIPEADAIVESAARAGALGARLTGAGWGGAVVVLTPGTGARRVIDEISDEFERRHGRRAAVWSSRAAAGVMEEAFAA